MIATLRVIAWLLPLVTSALEAQRPQFAPAVRQFIAVDTPVVAIRNVRVIDGTGAPAREGQLVVIREGKIAFVGPSSPDRVPASALVMDGTGKSVIPGLVMMHEHLFFPVMGYGYVGHHASFPRQYLAAGITTARTGGSMDPYAELNVKRLIDSGVMAGPALDVTGPYLDGPSSSVTQMHRLADAAAARRFVNYWADAGITSFKAYTGITRDQLRSAVEEAHKRGLKVTGHICSVTFREAAEIGIDNIEHGGLNATDFDGAAKQPDVCPSAPNEERLTQLFLAKDPSVSSLIRFMVSRKVALTSTLAAWEPYVAGRGPVSQRVLDALGPVSRERYLQVRAQTAPDTGTAGQDMLRAAMTFEKMYADAGGVLLVGTDPTSYGGVVPGASSHRAIVLLVEACLSPLEAIKIATWNGASYLGRADRIGSISVGKAADLVLVAGDPSKQIQDLERVELVFKDGVGFDSAKLTESGKGTVGVR